MGKILVVDFDGTLHLGRNFPNIGNPNVRLIRALKAAKATGCKLILDTCRSGANLTEALAWCEKQGLMFDKVNENLDELIERYGGDTRKICGDYYIDNDSFNAVDFEKYLRWTGVRF